MFVLQGLLLIVYAAKFEAQDLKPEPVNRMIAAGTAEFGVIWWSVLMVLGTESSWRSIAVFGVTPDATVLTTLGALPVLAIVIASMGWHLGRGRPIGRICP